MGRPIRVTRRLGPGILVWPLLLTFLITVDSGFVGTCDAAARPEPRNEATQIHEPLTSRTQTSEEALAQDLGEMATYHSWTTEEANAHGRGGEVVGRLAVEIASKWPEIFVGSALAEEPYDRPTLYLKGKAPAEVVRLISEAEVPVLLVDNQPYSFDELEQRSFEVHKALKDIGFDNLGTGFDVSARGVIDASVTRKPSLPDDPESIKRALPRHLRDSVNLTVSDTPVACLFAAAAVELVQR